MNRQLRVSLALLISGVMAGGIAPASAQVEEIVVTARKKEENLQEVPLAITTFSAEVLERKGIKNLSDIARLTAGLHFDTIFSPADTRVVIRGLSPSLGRPNVAFLQDGIDISSESVASAGGSLLANPRLFDLERVEVVKGPQSALYGRSAFAGAINYVTKRPGDEFEGKVSVDVGGDGQQELTGGISGPVVEGILNMGINASVWGHDGYYSNSVTGADIGGQEGFGVSVAAVLTPTDSVSVFARVEFTDDEFDIFPWSQMPGNTQLPIPPGAIGTVISPALTSVSSYAGSPLDADQQLVRSSPDPTTGADYPGTTREILRTSLILDWDLEWATLTWLSQYVQTDNVLKNENTRQGDVNNLQFFTLIDYDNDVKIWSQELRLSSDPEESFRWLVGANIWQENAHQDQRGFACLTNQVFPFLPYLPCGPLIAGLPPFPPRTFDRTEDSTSFYASVEFDLSDRVTVSLEGRYFEEDQEVWGPAGNHTLDPFGLAGGAPTFTFSPIPIPSIGATSSDSYFTPRAVLEFDATADAMLYLSIAQGGKPAGLSTTGAGAGAWDPVRAAFEQETVWVYEIGAKTTWLDGRLVANAAAYYQDFSEKQASSQILLSNGLLGTTIVNAADAEVTGFELDVSWALTDMLSASLAYSYVDATYKDFKTNTGGVAPIAEIGNCTPVTIAGSTRCEVDVSGNRLEDAAKNSLVLGLALQGSLNAQTEWLIETDAAFTGDRPDSNRNVLWMEDYWLVDLRVGLRGENWDVIAYAKNLFDDDTIKTAFLSTDFSTIDLFFFPPPFTFLLANGVQSRMPDPRQVGLRASYRF